MINIRYHVFSLVAVFLALAIGLAAGSTVVKESIVDNLRDNQDRLESDLDELRAANEELDLRVGRLEEADRRLRGEGPQALLDARLLGMTVVVVKGEGLDDTVYDAVLDTLVAAGAEVAGEIEIRREIVREERRAELANVVGASADDDPVVVAAQQLATALAVIDAPATPDSADGVPGEPTAGDGTPSDETVNDETVNDEAPGDEAASDGAASDGAEGDRSAGDSAAEPQDVTPTEPPPAEAPPPTAERLALDELLDVWEDAGFVDASGAVTDAEELIARAPVFVAVGGRPDGEDLTVTPFLTAFVDDVVAADGGRTRMTVADAALPDPTLPRSPFLNAVREMDVWDGVTSVDNLEMFAGLAALALGIEDLRVGRTGHYGVGDGADSLLPVDP